MTGRELPMHAQPRNHHITLSDLGLSWSPLAAEEAPSGMALWIEVTPAATEIRSAVVAGQVTFHETGVVAHLRARNHGDRPVVLPADVVLDGGRQARIVDRSILLAPSSETDVPVRCVEHGRWSSRRDRRSSVRDAADGDFESCGTVDAVTRSTFARSRSDSLRTRGQYRLDQQTVWTHVGQQLSRSEVRSSTESYVDFLGATRPRAARAARAMSARMPARANGLVVVNASGAAWAEVLPASEDLRTAAAALLADICEPHRAAPRSGPPPSPGEMLARMWSEQLVEVAVPGGTLGTSFVFREGPTLGSVLLVDGRLAHLAVGSAAEADPPAA